MYLDRVRPGSRLVPVMTLRTTDPAPPGVPHPPKPVAGDPLSYRSQTLRPKVKIPGRVWMVAGVFAFIVGGHLIEVVTQREHWPFSPYQMWSRATQDWNLTDERLYGVTDEASPREILLQDPTYFHPLPSRFMRLHMIKGINEKAKGNSQHLDAITADYLTRYEERRKAGLHSGPPLKGLRMYQFHWTMVLDGSNADKPDLSLMYQTDSVKGIVTPGPLVTTAKKGGGDVNVE